MMSIAAIVTSTAWRKSSMRNAPASSTNFMRLSEARLQAESSRCMYSEQGLDPLMRPLFGQVCQRLIVESYCMPGSPQTHAASEISRMKLTGREAVPPPESGWREERMRERLMPEPEPPLKMIPSLPIHDRIESIVSSTERMKQAEHCGFSRVPTLNQTGELNATFWFTSRWVSSASKVSASPASAK